MNLISNYILNKASILLLPLLKNIKPSLNIIRRKRLMMKRVIMVDRSTKVDGMNSRYQQIGILQNATPVHWMSGYRWK
jgi:hypothetical protein